MDKIEKMEEDASDIPKFAWKDDKGILNVIHEKSNTKHKYLYCKKVNKNPRMSQQEYRYLCKYIINSIKSSSEYEPDILETNRQVFCVSDYFEE